jgi:hypothetical protein
VRSGTALGRQWPSVVCDCPQTVISCRSSMAVGPETVKSAVLASSYGVVLSPQSYRAELRYSSKLFHCHQSRLSELECESRRGDMVLAPRWLLRHSNQCSPCNRAPWHPCVTHSGKQLDDCVRCPGARYTRFVGGYVLVASEVARPDTSHHHRARRSSVCL